MQESYNNNLHKYSSPKIYEFAKDLRHNSTEAEKLLWEQIRNKKLSGLKFRRQHPLDNYIADFYCHEKKLVIELDGEIHNNKEAKAMDANRTFVLNELKVTVMRFGNEEVINDLTTVIKSINEMANRLDKAE